MKFLKKLFLNFVLLLILLAVFYAVWPDLMGVIYKLYVQVLGPGLLFLLLVVTVLPRRRR